MQIRIPTLARHAWTAQESPWLRYRGTLGLGIDEKQVKRLSQNWTLTINSMYPGARV